MKNPVISKDSQKKGGGTLEYVSEKELLQVIEKQFNIDRTTTLNLFMANKRQEILKKHPCRIWQGTNNGMWYTYILESNGKRRLVKKSTREKIEDVIIECYKDEPTIDEIFNRWIDEKMSFGEISESTRDRYVADYHRYFADMSRRKIQTVTENELEYHIKSQISQHNLTSKAYGGLRTIVIGVWGYAYKYKYTDIAIRTFFSEIRLSSKIFSHKPRLCTDNVFTEHEVELITNHLLNNNPNVISFGIVLGLRSGLRVGELCSLKKDDVTDHCLRINKTETRYRVEQGEYIREIKDNAKTEAGNRFVLIDDVAMELIDKIKSQNQQSDYLFAINGKRCIGQSFTRKLERTCEALGIKPRSMHKCRKTYITTLINANVPESLIIDQVGHTDIKTSKQFYLYNNKTKNEALRTLSDAIAKR